MKQDGTWPLVSAARMRALDAYTVEELGVSADALMESAGRAVVETLLSTCGPELATPGAEVLVVCGTGNNGGDGLVVARHLAQLGHPVRGLLLGRLDALSPTCALNYQRARAAGVRIDTEASSIPDRGVLVDAIFGTGLSRDVKGETAAWIERMNGSAGPGLKIVAVDLPSGLHSETGQVLGTAVRADVTVTVGCSKVALVLEPGRSLAGRIYVARVGIVDELPGDEVNGAWPGLELWSRRAAAERLPARPAAGHKGRFGHVLLVAGSEGKTGAAALCARAALRAGAGLVTLGCPHSLNSLLEAKCTEVMTVPLAETEALSVSDRALETVVALARDRDVLGIGPGLGTHPDTRRLVLDLLGALAAPLVIDADGVNALQGELPLLRAREGRTVLTPHPGEAARLLETTAAAINADRVGSARELADRSGAVVVLKG
ncbi:MAG: NAD(P)H-hydrate epimerase, partial [Myxococcota bacterium]